MKKGKDEQDRVTFVLFGATGDLAKRKLIPALSLLFQQGVFSKGSRIVAIGRKNLDEKGYMEMVNSGNLPISYITLDISDKDSLSSLKKELEKVDYGKNKRVFYLSTSQELFSNIVDELKRQKLNDGDSKIVFEKPFGYNSKSSEEINNLIGKAFKEEQIFRVDHYLAKETVQNINILKFTNPIFMSFLNGKYVESIEVIAEEDMGVGERLGYYDKTGAIKDMVQNHLLQMLSLVLMEKPSEFNAERIHDEKVRVLKDLDVGRAEQQILGQYDGYNEEVRKNGGGNSLTETYAKIILSCSNDRWNGVELVLKTGKKMKEKKGQIIINFKPALIEEYNGISGNKIIIDIYPKQDVRIVLNTRNPNSENEVVPVDFQFCRECEFGPNSKDEYATLIGDVLKGEKTLFTRFDELQECWRIVDDLELIKEFMKFRIYEDGKEPEN